MDNKDCVVAREGGVDGALPKKTRSSNLELYRIIVMLLIVAHHYVVNSGLTAPDGPVTMNPEAPNSIYLLLFGAWGKTGINCFVMITGYFMCTSRITVRKFLKLILQVYLYRIIFFAVFLGMGYEMLSLNRLFKLALPLGSLGKDFVGCFLVFYLTIPFWNILIRNISRREHLLLAALLLSCYTLLGSLPVFSTTFNYVTWFGIIYLTASYIRLYPARVFERRSLWGWLTAANIMLAAGSILAINHVRSSQGSVGLAYFFVSDSNKIFAVTIAICSFLWFKNMQIKYSKLINAFGAATFGVLLIHANSDAMRTWLWKDFIDCVGHYAQPLGHLVLYSVSAVVAIFIVCNLIDQVRINTLEKRFFQWYDRRMPKTGERAATCQTDNK